MAAINNATSAWASFANSPKKCAQAIREYLDPMTEKWENKIEKGLHILTTETPIPRALSKNNADNFLKKGLKWYVRTSLHAGNKVGVGVGSIVYGGFNILAAGCDALGVKEGGALFRSLGWIVGMVARTVTQIAVTLLFYSPLIAAAYFAGIGLAGTIGAVATVAGVAFLYMQLEIWLVNHKSNKNAQETQNLLELNTRLSEQLQDLNAKLNEPSAVYKAGASMWRNPVKTIIGAVALTAVAYFCGKLPTSIETGIQNAANYALSINPRKWTLPKNFNAKACAYEWVKNFPVLGHAYCNAKKEEE